MGAPINSSSQSLLERISWDELDARVARQQRNREVHSPAISLFRWWARRPHALIGEILDAAPDSWKQISDPFSGGGTVAIEAAERGLGIYAQDLHPWATHGLATTLDRVNPDDLAEAGRRWLASLADDRRRLYGSGLPGRPASEVITTFWVRACNCPACAADAYLFPYPLVSLASRKKDESYAYFGCSRCGTMVRSNLRSHRRSCSNCGNRLGDPDSQSFPQGIYSCRNPNCGHEFPAFEPSHRWQPVLVQRLERGQVCIERATEADVAAALAGSPDPPEALRAEIPSGLETRRLHRAGITHWIDLYPPRQLESMLLAADKLRELEAQPEVVARLRLILCGASEMAGYGSRWDRYYPKAFEAMANHRFSVTGFAAETNLLADRGRGTLARRILHSVRAARWAQRFPSRKPRTLSVAGNGQLTARDLRQPTVVQGSSNEQLLPDASVDLVLTDPPYFDDVQYAELGALFLVWAQATGLVSKSVHLDLRSEVVPNSERGVDAEGYCSLLAAVLGETRRTIKPGGRMVLTFHNTDGRAWWALARALGKAGFSVNALAVAHAENESDHAKRGRRAFSRDLILECRPNPSGDAPPVVVTEARNAESRELLAAGRAVAGLAARVVADGSVENYHSFGARYREHLQAAKSLYIRFGADPSQGGQRG